MLKNLQFDSYQFNSRKEILIGIDKTNKFVIKIQIKKNKNKAKDIQQEYEVLKHLNQKGCQTCPTAYEFGTIAKNDIYTKTEEKYILDSLGETDFQYIIQDYLPNNDTYRLADIILTLIEQKKLGVYQGDVKPANIRYNSSNGVCYFIDYDQAIFLNNNQSHLSNINYLEFCSDYDKTKHGFGDWLRHFSNFRAHDLPPLFKSGALNLAETTLLKTQNTTNSLSGIYHTINTKDIFTDGSRTVTARAQLLDKLEFKTNEKVLDVGCNSGLLSMYLYDRGCNVTGIDNDPHIITASKIISNILEKDIQYAHIDLDEVEQIDVFDTVMLFSVFHHTKDPAKNAKKIVNSCSRIILETRLVENGAQPIGPDGTWVNVSHWEFNNLEQLIDFCERTFEGFKLRTNLGLGDKNRYMLEFVK